MKSPRGLVELDLQRDGRVFVQPFSVTVDGPWILNGLPVVLASVEDVGGLGNAVLRALDASYNTVLPARNLRADPPDREFLEWLGVRSYAQYAKGVRAVTVHGFFEGDVHILVTPQSNGGGRAGFEPIVAHRVRLDDWSAQPVGTAVQAAFEIATV